MTYSNWNGSSNPWGAASSSTPWLDSSSYRPSPEDVSSKGGASAQVRCSGSTDCGSGFACIDGICVLIQDEDSSACIGNGGGSGAGGSCSGSASGSISSCTTSTPGDCMGSVVGGGGQSTCGDQEPIPPGGNWGTSPGGGCSGFCDSWKDSFGYDPPGCEGKSCGACEECGFFSDECEPAADDTCQCGGAKPESIGRCYRCSPSGSWLISNCPLIPDPKPAAPTGGAPECEPKCTTSEVCVNNPTLGTTTCTQVEQCGDIPESCEATDCDCDANCPACQSCVNGACVKEDGCTPECNGVPCEGRCVQAVSAMGRANSYGPWSLGSARDSFCSGVPGISYDDPDCPGNCGGSYYDLTVTLCDGTQRTTPIIQYNCEPNPGTQDLGLVCCD